MVSMLRSKVVKILGVFLWSLIAVHCIAAVELKDHIPGEAVAAARHTASDHVREILGRAFGSDDHSSHSHSHSSSSSDEHSDNNGRRSDRHRESCRYVSRSGKDCKCRCYDSSERQRASGLFGGH
uniref:Uncharacterized protein n=1 Tax=Anopheles atroparvus TaxID=41427 RepID=A0A182IQR5_ANOAO